MKTWMFSITILGLALACHRRVANTNPKPSSVQSTSQTVEPRSLNDRKDLAPTELMATATSAFVACLHVDKEAIYLLTERIAYRFVPGASPQTIPVENGGMAAVTRTDLIYWFDGAIWSIPKTGGTARRIAALAHKPQFFMASGDDIAWLDMPVWDRFLIQTLDGKAIRSLLYYAGRIETATMDAGRIFFVRKDADASWAVGSISIRGGDPVYAARKTGPTPAKLAAAGDLFYYDMTSNEIRRLSPDLSREEIITKELICSPLTVATKIYCPNVGGLFALPRELGAKSTSIFPEPRTIANVAASSNFLAWLSDAGPDRLSLMMLPLMPVEKK